MEIIDVQTGLTLPVIKVFENAFDMLGVRVDPGTLEELANLIYQGMTVQARKYHNLDHVFSIVDETSPIITLASLFHDLVYCQVDDGFLPAIHKIIDPFVVEKEGKIWILEQKKDEDKLIHLVKGIFGFSEGQSISPTNGLNEFLSSVVMVRKLENILPVKYLFQLILCVEASIPFRDSAASGEDYFYTLERKAFSMNEHFKLGLSRQDIIEGVKLAVQFANRDVASFADEDVACYLETTWKLLPELYSSIPDTGIFSIRDYRLALQSMEKVLSRLNPDKVFHQYCGVPADSEYHAMVQMASRNIRNGLEYLGIKLIAQAILEALANETGGDAPLSDFINDRSGDDGRVFLFESQSPQGISPEWVNTTSDVFRLLDVGPGCDYDFDLQTAPLSLFIYQRLPPTEINRLLTAAKDLFDERITSAQFLSQIEPSVLSVIASALADQMSARRDQLSKYVTSTDTR